MGLNKNVIDVNLYRVYENPSAEVLYKQAQKAQNWQEKAKLFAEMGHYELVDYGSGLKGFFRKLFNIKKRVVDIDLTNL